MSAILKQASTVPDTVGNPGRLAVLVNTGALSDEIEESFDRLTRLAAHTIVAPVSLVSLMDGDRQFFKSSYGLSEPWRSRRGTPLTHSFCKHVVSSGMPLLIEDATTHPSLKNNLAIRELGVIAYAGMPLTLKNGQTIGSLCVIDHRPRRWERREVDLLSDIACSVMAEIELRMLMMANEELWGTIFHDLKNPLGAILLSSEMMKQSPEVANHLVLRRIVEMIFNSAERMNQIIGDISELHHLECGDSVMKREDCDVGGLMDAAISRVRPISDPKRIEFRTQVTPRTTAFCDRSRTINALADLILLLVRRSPDDQLIEVEAFTRRDALQFQLRDSGPPFTTEDTAHLFDRFRQSPALKNKAEKYALCLANEVIKANGGTVVIDSANGEGNLIRISLPVRMQ